jgi:hypothetical protein
MTPQQIDAMKLALGALKLLTDTEQTFGALDYGDNAITALEEVLAEHAMQEVQRLGQEIEQEPVFTYEQVKAHIQVAMMSTTPPQHTWVGLTEQDLDYLCNLAYTGDEEFALAVQAKLMEKNA